MITVRCRCGGRLVVHEGDVVCPRCGLVYSQSQYYSGVKPEEERAQRVRPSATYYGVITSINGRFKGVQRMLTTGREKAVSVGLKILRSVAGRLSLPGYIREDAAHIYRVATSMFKGKAMRPMLAACLYAACRRAHIGRSISEIAEAFNIDSADVGRYLRTITKAGIKVPPPRAEDYVPRIASKLELPDSVVAKALMAIRRAGPVWACRKPETVAAAAIYMVSNLSRKQIAEAAGVCDSIISVRLRELRDENLF